jgi:antitoxin component of RelBE/YafQ-DinJ toxin-antitoxin module
MTIKTRLDPALHEAAKQVAARLGISLTEYLRRLVLEDLAARNGGISEVPPSGGGGGGNIVR